MRPSKSADGKTTVARFEPLDKAKVDPAIQGILNGKDSLGYFNMRTFDGSTVASGTGSFGSFFSQTDFDTVSPEDLGKSFESALAGTAPSPTTPGAPAPPRSIPVTLSPSKSLNGGVDLNRVNRVLTLPPIDNFPDTGGWIRS